MLCGGKNCPSKLARLKFTIKNAFTGTNSRTQGHSTSKYGILLKRMCRHMIRYMLWCEPEDFKISCL